MRAFKVDISALISNARSHLNKRVVGVEITLAPGINYVVAPHDPEVTIARRVLAFMKDRRVLNSQECCDGCIKHAMESLLKIRGYIVERQEELVHQQDGALYLLLEFIIEPIRQYMTYCERLTPLDTAHSRKTWQPYFDALNQLRAHLSTTLHQIEVIAQAKPPSMPANLRPSMDPDAPSLDQTP